ncbi:MAG: hypothetical protein IPN76_13340 [Saprospiraceae bacterium]|nr:hypothetical protein [Saprospiraceae bacterium]
MNYKFLGVLGLFMLAISRLLMLNGEAFIQSQQPFDFVHLLMLAGAVLTLSLSHVFPKNIFNSIATPLTILGIIAHVGMCAIDFVFWSFGDDSGARNALVGHLLNKPVIWLPFFVIGPALLFVGITTQAWHFIKSQPVAVLLALLGGTGIGLGQMVFNNQLLIVISYFVFAIGVTMLVYRKTEK